MALLQKADDICAVVLNTTRASVFFKFDMNGFCLADTDRDVMSSSIAICHTPGDNKDGRVVTDRRL